jgi:copper chaperone
MQLTFTVLDMACGACADKITQAIQSIDPQATISADPKTKLVQIESALPVTTLETTITTAGYTVSNRSST